MIHGRAKKLWRYVDDLLMITTMEENEVKEYVDNLNKIKSKIRFTYEYEDQGSINYLDTHLTRTDNDNVKIRWHRKSTATDRFLNYKSAHHISVKRNIVTNMAKRIIETSKDPVEQKEDLNKLRKMLENSEYPSHEVNRLIEDAMRGRQKTMEKKEEMKYTVSLPYTDGIGVLKRKLETLKIKVYFTYPNKIMSPCSTPMRARPKAVIYQLPCECGAIYNGETKIGIDRRIAQHQKIIDKDEKDSKSEMVQHHYSKGHMCMFNSEKAFIIDKEIDRKKRRIKETIYSIVNHSVNRRDDIDQLWYPLIHKSTTRIKQIKQKTSERNNGCKSQDGDSGTDEED